MKSKKSAFTLIEILIVVGIIVMLLGISTQMLSSSSEAQGKARAKADMETIATALEQFSALYGDYPRLSCSGQEKYAAAQLYQCLIGKMYMTVENGLIAFKQLSQDVSRAPFLDASKMSLGNITDNDSDIDTENTGTFFADPWGEPYLYIYNNSTEPGSGNIWKSTKYILLSKGPDSKAVSFGSMYSDGIMRDVDAYRMQSGNEDNIVRGID